jgi:hypothetical protein
MRDLWNDCAVLTCQSRGGAILVRLRLPVRRFGPAGRVGGRADLGIGVDVHHPDLDQLWSSLRFGSRGEA